MNDPRISPNPWFFFENFDACYVVHTQGFSGLVHGCSWYHKLKHAGMVSQGKIHSGFSMEDLHDHDACINSCSVMVTHGSCAHGFHGICAHGFPWNLCSWFPMECVFMEFYGFCAHGFLWNVCSWSSMDSVLMGFHGICCAQGLIAMEQQFHGFPGKMLSGFCHGIYAQDFPGKLWSVQARFPREPSLQDVSKSKVLY